MKCRHVNVLRELPGDKANEPSRNGTIVDDERPA
jgi:hypothetical protein